MKKRDLVDLLLQEEEDPVECEGEDPVESARSKVRMARREMTAAEDAEVERLKESVDNLQMMNEKMKHTASADSAKTLFAQRRQRLLN